MIQETKELVTQEIEKTIEKKYFCDKCLCEIKSDYHEIETYKVVFKEGWRYPEGGNIEIEEAYFCEECKEVIKNLLIRNGVKFTNREIDY